MFTLERTMQDRLKRIFDDMGGKVEEIAKRLNVTTVTIYNYIKGKNKSYPHEFLIDLKEETGVNLNWLFTGKGDIYTQDKSSSSLNKRFLQVALWAIDNYLWSVSEQKDTPLLSRDEKSKLITNLYASAIEMTEEHPEKFVYDDEDSFLASQLRSTVKTYFETISKERPPRYYEDDDGTWKPC